jgi:hypothetical protein
MKKDPDPSAVIRLNATGHFSASDLVTLLNDPEEIIPANRIWIGDAFHETTCSYANPEDIVENRRAARAYLLQWLDQWIDSGKRNGQESSGWRNEAGARERFRVTLDRPIAGECALCRQPRLPSS